MPHEKMSNQTNRAANLRVKQEKTLKTATGAEQKNEWVVK